MSSKSFVNCSEHRHLQDFGFFYGFWRVLRQKSSKNCTEVMLKTTVKPVKIDYFSMSDHVFWCKIWCRFWFCHQTLSEIMIWLRYRRSKSKSALKVANSSILHVAIAVKPVKIDYLSELANVLGCGIRWKIWFCYPTLSESMIWLTYGRSKSKSGVKVGWVRKGLT